jgi:hypothetical protein
LLTHGKDKTIPVTSSNSPQSLWHSLDNQLTEDDKVVSFMGQPPSTPRMIPDTNLCLRLSWTGRIRWTEISYDLIRNGTCSLPDCSTVCPPTTLTCKTWQGTNS